MTIPCGVWVSTSATANSASTPDIRHRHMYVYISILVVRNVCRFTYVHMHVLSCLCVSLVVNLTTLNRCAVWRITYTTVHICCAAEGIVENACCSRCSLLCSYYWVGGWDWSLHSVHLYCLLSMFVRVFQSHMYTCSTGALTRLTLCEGRVVAKFNLCKCSKVVCSIYVSSVEVPFDALFKQRMRSRTFKEWQCMRVTANQVVYFMLRCAYIHVVLYCFNT